MRTRPPIRLLLVDDHELVRMGLIAAFAHSPSVRVVGEAASAAQAVAQAARLHPDVVLMDLRLPDESGLAACREIVAAQPGVRVLFLTSYTDDEAILATLLARASGYLLKDIDRAGLLRAIEQVAAGASIIDPRLGQDVLQHAQGERGDSLSPQECRVLALVVEGKTNKEIADALELSDKTVKNYLSNAFQKLRVSRRSQAAAIFSRRGQ